MSEPSEKKPVPVLFLNTPSVHPALIALQENLFKRETEFSLDLPANQQKAFETLDREKHGVVLFEIHNKDQFIEIANLLPRLTGPLRQGRIKVWGIVTFEADKLGTFLMKKGCSEVLPASTNQRSMIHKFDRTAQIVSAQYAKFISEGAIEETLKPEGAGKSQKAPGRSNELPAAVINWVDALSLSSDFWLLKSRKDVRRVMGKWVLDVIGPPPSFGKWEPIAVGAAPVSRAKAKLWRFTPRGPRPPFYLDEGHWQFSGKEPVFSWKTMNWRFVGETAGLEFFKSNGSEPVQQKVCARFGLNNGAFDISKNSPKADEIAVKIAEYLKIEITEEAKKKPEGTKDYQELKKRLDQLGLGFKLDKETSHQSASGSYKIEDTSAEKGTADYLQVADPESDGPELKTSPELEGVAWNGALIDPKIPHKNPDLNAIDWLEVLKDPVISIMMTNLTHSTQNLVRLLDYFDSHLSCSAPTLSGGAGDEVDLEIDITTPTGKLKFNIPGKIAENSAIDEAQDSIEIDLTLTEATTRALQELLKYFTARQETAALFFHTAKGERYFMSKPVASGAPKNAKIEEKLALLKGFLQKNSVFIVDSSSASRTRIAKSLIDLGAKTTSVTMHGKFEEALPAMIAAKPKVVIADYYLGASSGFELFQQYRKTLTDTKDCLFIMVTANTTQSTVARAAEEDIDGFILKPYTPKTFSESLAECAVAKIFPNAYQQKINEGKVFLLEAKPDEAMARFNEAKKLSDKPALACFYHGQAELMKKALEEAKGDYSKGLSYNKIHYKCLVALFDLLMQKKEFDAAYDVVKKISQYFPANPDRLASVLRLAVTVQKFEDMESYYLIFTQLDIRTDEVTKFVCAGLVVTAQYYFRTKVNTRAVDILNKTAVSCGAFNVFLLKAIELLVAYNYKVEAENTFKRFRPEDKGNRNFEIAKFLYESLTLNPKMTIRTGEELIKAGHHWPSLYATLIKLNLDIGDCERANYFHQIGCKNLPHERPTFDKALTRCSRRSADDAKSKDVFEKCSCRALDQKAAA